MVRGMLSARGPRDSSGPAIWSLTARDSLDSEGSWSKGCWGLVVHVMLSVCGSLVSGSSWSSRCCGVEVHVMMRGR